MTFEVDSRCSNCPVIPEPRTYLAEMPSSTYAAAGIMLILALGLGLAALGLGRILGPRPRRKQDNPPPEHDGPTVHKTCVQFRVRYAILAMLFVAFDMEMVFMFPWAVAFKRLGLVAFLDMFVFIAILAAAIVFAWKEGAFDWED
jgi:NADH-quinone oxidoreductase subunit A